MWGLVLGLLVIWYYRGRVGVYDVLGVGSGRSVCSGIVAVFESLGNGDRLFGGDARCFTGVTGVGKGLSEN